MSGTEKSGGNFTIWKSDADDGQDLGDWIVEQEWSNGVVYSFGGSADGIAAHRLPYNKPSWLHGQAFLVSSALLYETLFPNGAYLQSLVESWMKGTVRDWEFERVLGTVKENEMRTEWWDDREMTGKYETLVKFPATFWAGWYDIFLGPNLLTFNGYNYQSDLSVRGTAKIVVDPLGHCQDAASFFPQNLVQGRSLVGMANMYELFGVPRRDHTRPRLKNVTFYVMSSNDAAGLAIGNYWTSLDQFPEVRPVRFFLRADGSLSTVHLGAKDQEAVNSSFVYDPANPVPTKGGANLDLPCGPLDQKDDAGTPLDERADVLVFETDQVAEKEALWLTGALSATLHVASSAIDTDFTVKLSDVYPSGEVGFHSLITCCYYLLPHLCLVCVFHIKFIFSAFISHLTILFLCLRYAFFKMETGACGGGRVVPSLCTCRALVKCTAFKSTSGTYHTSSHLGTACVPPSHRQTFLALA
jgi:predicted acyl esterase